MRSEEPKAPSIVSDGLMKIRDAAKFLGLSRSTLYKLMETGKLSYVKIETSRLVPRRAVVELAERSLVGVGAAS